ncbi:MAG TPA: TolC family protein [Bryobacteraceae bacterium]|nr:TolC family protein [Bryobacteraceae bacterium]
MSYRSNALALALACACSMRAVESVRLADLIPEALANNREVLAAQKRYEAARQRPLPARSLPDPIVSVGYASNGGPLPGQGLGSNPTSNIGVMISQELPYPGKRKLRGDIAVKDAEAEFEQYQATALSVRSRVIQAFHRLHHTWAALEILTRGKEVVATLIRAAEARYTAGKTMQQEIFRAQTQLSILETRIIRMEEDRRSAEAEINSLLNRAPGSPLGEPLRTEPSPLSITVEELLARSADMAPELKRDEAMIQRGELGVNLARKEFRPDYTIAAGYFNQGGMAPMYQLRVDIPIRLHAESRQRPALNEQVDLLAEARRNFEAAEQALQFRVRDAYIAAETAWRLRSLYADTILPQMQLTVDSSLAAYQTGGTDLAAVLNNVAARVDAEEQVHEQELNYALALARLEEMTGVELAKGETR